MKMATLSVKALRVQIITKLQQEEEIEEPELSIEILQPKIQSSGYGSTSLSSYSRLDLVWAHI